MHRTTGAGNIDGMFVAEDPTVNRPPTEVTAEWLNTLQEEIATYIEAGGGVLNPAVNNQLLTESAWKTGLKFLLANNAINPNGQIDISIVGSISALFPATLTKTLQPAGVWAAGSGNNGLFSGSLAINTWYHVFLIRKISDGTVDAGFDTSITAAHIPAGYGAYRRIGSVMVNSLGHIVPFVQTGNIVRYRSLIIDVSIATPGSLGVLATLSVPPGLRVTAMITGSYYSSSTTGDGVLFTCPDDSDELPNTINDQLIINAGVLQRNNGSVDIMTNTSSQIRYRCAIGDSTDILSISTRGWIDHTL